MPISVITPPSFALCVCDICGAEERFNVVRSVFQNNTPWMEKGWTQEPHKNKVLAFCPGCISRDWAAALERAKDAREKEFINNHFQGEDRRTDAR